MFVAVSLRDRVAVVGSRLDRAPVLPIIFLLSPTFIYPENVAVSCESGQVELYQYLNP